LHGQLAFDFMTQSATRERDQGSPGSPRLTPLCHILFRPLMNHINIPRCRTVSM